MFTVCCFPFLVEDEKAGAMSMLAETLHAGDRPRFQDVLCFRFHHFSYHIWVYLQILFTYWYAHALFTVEAC